MIYMRGGKLLVSADGKLCSSCCTGDDCDACEPDPFPNGQTPKYFSVTFSGVTLCPDIPWPNGVNLNATWELTQVAVCQWQYLDDDWNINLYLNYLGVTWLIAKEVPAPAGTFYSAYGLSQCTAEGVNIANDVTCIGGYRAEDGVANWNF